MRFKVGTYLIFGGAALFIVASKLEGAISVLPEVAGSVDSKQKQSGGAQSEAKALFDAWLRQQGIPADITLAERQSCYEVFHTLYEKGELDLIGLRRATREQDK